MTIKIFQAECGDAASIRYFGNDNKYHNVFIDSGFHRTYRSVLANEIDYINNNDELIDLWCISHIHEDHIAGALKYIEVIQDGEVKDIVKEWVYNPPRGRSDDIAKGKNKISTASSIDQGDLLHKYLIQNSKLPSIDVTSELLPIDLFGLKITILTPAPAKLAALRKKYCNNSALERIEQDAISVARASLGNDYLIPTKSFNLNLQNEDYSVENGSSISMLTEFNNTKILWLADSHPTDIVKQLVKMGYSNENRITCDFIKVSHHGSSGNNNSELYDLIDCQNYLFSVNGENIYNLPSKACIARILRSRMRNMNTHYNLYFTYDNKTLRNIFKCDGEEIYDELNYSVHYLTEKKYLEFDLFKAKPFL